MEHEEGGVRRRRMGPFLRFLAFGWCLFLWIALLIRGELCNTDSLKQFLRAGACATFLAMLLINGRDMVYEMNRTGKKP